MTDESLKKTVQHQISEIFSPEDAEGVMEGIFGPCKEHELYCVSHPRKGGKLIYCCYCSLTAEGATESEAWDNWHAGHHIDQFFERDELVG